jgi:biopolymer transport protein ExbD
MVDIMFLLLLFFMLSADIGQRDIEDVRLPLASTVKEDKDAKEGKDRERLTINVYHRYERSDPCSDHEAGRICVTERHWQVGVRGGNYTEPERLFTLLKEEANLDRGDDPQSRASDRRVMIRADASAPYGYIQDVMGACARVGIYQIECGAAQPEEEKKKPADSA